MSVSTNRAAKQGSVGVQVSAQQRGLFLRLLVLGGVIMLVSQIVISWIALQGFEDDLKPELNRKAIAVGRALTSELSYAINDLGIPPSELVGVDEYFRHILDANTDIQFLALVDGSSRVMYERNLPQDLRGRLKENAYDPRAPAQAYWTGNIGKYIDSGFPIYSNGNLNATLHVGVSGDNVRRQLATVLYEIIAVGTEHCLVMSPLYASMQQIIYGYRNQTEIPVAISIYRFVDRIGLVVGTLLVALLVQKISNSASMGTIGGVVILAIVLTLVVININRRRAPIPGGVRT